MGTPVSSVRVWRFGVFEADASSGELRRNGNRIKLQEQPARILTFLLEHAGEMVTREELRQHLWPADTFVDFDHSLNTAVMKLREALGDSADKPLYIETIPRKGYRFVAPVLESLASTFRADASRNGAIHLPEMIPPSLEGAGPDIAKSQVAAAPEEQPARGPSRLRLVALSTMSAVILLVVAGWLAWRAPADSRKEAQEAASPNLRIVPLTHVIGYVDNPAFSPDGRQIAFTWQPADQARADIYVQMIGGEAPLRLTHNVSGFVDFPQWSPDGGQIAFTWCGGKSDGVYVVPTLGGAARELANIDCRYWGWRRWGGGRPIWTSDGKSMLFIDRCTPAGPQGIVLFSLATGLKRCLTAPDSPNAYDFMEALSPDGKTVALLRGTSTAVADLYTVPLSGGVPHRLTFENHSMYALMWAPDGRSIVFESDRGVTPNTWRIAATGGAIRPETVYPRVGSLSNDGRRFSYVQKLSMEHAIWRADLPTAGCSACESSPIRSTRRNKCRSPRMARA